MEICVPRYDGKSFKYSWDEGFCIQCDIEENTIVIKANKAGLISLARHLLELSQDGFPPSQHIHLDSFNSLEDGSAELIIVKTK